MTIRKLLVLAALVAAPSLAHAAIYAKVQAFVNKPSDIQVDSVAAFRGSLDTNIGWSGALGYKFSLIRAELELQNFRNDVASAGNSAGAATSSSELKQLNGFVNGFVDLPSFFGLAPYAGAGLGFARADFGNFSAAQSGTDIVRFSGTESAFAYQVAAGLQFHIFGQATLHAGFRWVKMEDIELNTAAAAVQTVRLGENKIFEVGLSVGF